ncbi:hypothetical protein [Fischerella major]|uniref:hypothetical protein n=1 Tax=Fischerella major TaxID=210993 RepID=UPI001161441D|nr:hypothetical protein [Fischerella major]
MSPAPPKGGLRHVDAQAVRQRGLGGFPHERLRSRSVPEATTRRASRKGRGTGEPEGWLMVDGWLFVDCYKQQTTNNTS